MSTSKDNLIEKIDKLKKENTNLKALLKKSESHTYIHETHTLYASDGEFYFYFGDEDNPRTLVYNINSLYNDLPFIISQTVNEQTKQQKEKNKQIMDSLKK